VQGAVAATGNQGRIALIQRLAHQPLRIAWLPGDTNRQIQPRLATLFNRLAYLIVERLFSMQYQQRLGIAHGSSFLAIGTAA